MIEIELEKKVEQRDKRTECKSEKLTVVNGDVLLDGNAERNNWKVPKCTNNLTTTCSNTI